MSKLRVATRLADELGTSLSKAQRFVSDVGPTKAEDVLDGARGAARGGDDGFDLGTKLLAGGTVATGGGLAYRQQSVWAEQEDSAQTSDQVDGLKALLEDEELSAEDKRKLVEDYLDSLGDFGANGDDSDDNGGGWPPELPDFGDMFGNAQTILVLVIVAAIVLKFAMEDD